MEGFNLERGRSPSEWHLKQGHRHHQMNSRMYMEKMEPSSGVSPCACHMRRQYRVMDEPLWMQEEQWCYQSKEFLSKPSCAEGSPARFSVRTPLRGGERSLFCPPGRMGMTGARGGPSIRPMFLPSENQISLQNWFLIPVKESEGPSGDSPVAVGGFIRYGHDTEFRRTGPITDRNDKGRLKTVDGTEVRLVGCIDEKATTANGFTAELPQYFYTGFPVTWKRVLEEERTRKIQQDAEHVDKPSSPGCIETRDSAELFSTPQATADSTLHGDGAPFFEQPVRDETGRRSAGDQEIGVAEDKIAERNRDEVSLPSRNDKEPQGGEVPVDTAYVGSRKRSGKRLPTRSSMRLRKARGQESEMGTSEARTKGGEQNATEHCCTGEMNCAADASNREQQTTSARKKDLKENSEQESDGSNELKDRVSVDKAEGDLAQVDVVSAPEIFSAVSAEPPLAQNALEPVAVSQDNIAEAVPQGDVEVVAELSVLEAEIDAPKAAAETNGQQSTARKRSRGRGAPRTGKRRKTTSRKTVEAVQETSKKEQLKVEEAGAALQNMDPPEAPAEDNRSSKRTSRKRAVRTEENQMPSVPVVHVIDSDDESRPVDEARPVDDDGKQVVESKELEVSVCEDKLNSRKASGRTKRSSLPPPLPASRVVRKVEKSDVIEAFGLKTSRSGRLLVPPLAYWRNQTVSRDRDGGIIAIMDGFQEPPSDTGYYNFKPPTGKRRLQEKLCATAADSPRRASDKGKKKIRGSK